MLNQILSKWREINWVALLISVVAQVATVFFIPIQYSKNISTATFEFNLWVVGLYAIMIAISGFLLFTSNFRSPFAILPIIASFVLTFSGIIKGNLILMLLLLLLPIFLLLVQIGYTQLQNEFGLLIYSLLTTLSVPVTITFMSAHFLSWTYLTSLLPLFALSILFLAPVFITKAKLIFTVTTTLSGIVAIILILTSAISFKGILAIILIILAWFTMFNFPKMNYKFLTYSIVELLIILLIY